MANGLEIFDYTGEGYMPMIDFESWRVAFLRYEPRFEHTTQIERHMETDEVFVLLEGEATLLIGTEMTPCPMEKFKMYNVKKAVWHNIRVSKDARVLIVENRDTTTENSEYMAV